MIHEGRGRPSRFVMGTALSDAEVMPMVRGFEVDECRVPETAPCEWVCRGCGEVNPVALGAPAMDQCEGCGAFRPTARRVRG